jgi:hypothetical protein
MPTPCVLVTATALPKPGQVAQVRRPALGLPDVPKLRRVDRPALFPAAWARARRDRGRRFGEHRRAAWRAAKVNAAKPVCQSGFGEKLNEIRVRATSSTGLRSRR